MIDRICTRHMPGEQLKVTAKLNSIVTPQMDDGAVEELHMLKAETIRPGMFAFAEDVRSVASRLTGLVPASVMTFGTADKIMRLQE